MVVAIGDEVSLVSIGDRVGVCPLGPSGSEPGYNRDGGFATHAIVPAIDLVAIPDSVGFAAAAVGVDAGATSHHAVKSVGRVVAGMRVGVIGLGGLGQFGARIAVLAGAAVIGCDTNPRARALAAGLGVANVVSSVADMREFEPEVILDFAGFGSTTADAINSVRPGGTVVLVGMGALTSTISTRDLISRQVTLVGSLGGTRGDVGEVYRMIADGDLSPQVESISFLEIPKGLDRLAAGDVRGRLVAVFD